MDMCLGAQSLNEKSQKLTLFSARSVFIEFILFCIWQIFFPTHREQSMESYRDKKTKTRHNQNKMCTQIANIWFNIHN